MNPKHFVMGIVLLAITACGGGGDGDGGGTASRAAKSLDTPHGTILANIHAFRRNDFASLIEINFTDEQLQEMKADWAEQKSQEPSEEDKAQFAQSMAMLTADGSEDTIMMLLEPQLVQVREKMPEWINLSQAMGGIAIATNEEIPADQKELATNMLNAVTAWAKETDLGSSELAREAVGIAAATARDLEIATIDDMQALEFEQMLEKAGMAFGGTKDVLSVYGLSLNDMLDSVEAKTVNDEGESATVEMTFEFLGVEQTVPVEMVRENGRWISSDFRDGMTEL